MVVTDMLSNALSWTYRQMQHYKTKEQLQIAYNLLQRTVYEAERKRQAEEIKALRLEKELQAQRERLGRDLHDGFGSQLTHIISRLDLMACAGTSNVNQLLCLSEFAREMNQTLRETIWLLDRQNVTVEDFSARLYGMLIRIWDDRELPKLHLKIVNTPENSVLSPLVALHLVRITQEATNNALKYAKATVIEITLADHKSTIQLTIKDNGKGFETNRIGAGFGLTNMRKRAEEVNGTFELQTSPSGTTIHAILPINN